MIQDLNKLSSTITYRDLVLCIPLELVIIIMNEEPPATNYADIAYDEPQKKITLTEPVCVTIVTYG